MFLSGNPGRVVARVGSRQDISGMTGEKEMEVMRKDRALSLFPFLEKFS